MDRQPYHTPVLLQEVLSSLTLNNQSQVIDATLGGGGHTKAMAETGAHVLAIDHDPDAITHANQWLPDYPNVCVKRGAFQDIKQLAQSQGFRLVDAILFDLGVSSHQLDAPMRGFSFLHEAPLDMRMDPSLQIQARDLINALGEKELTQLFYKYGQEPKARRIAQAIVGVARHQQFATTTELANVIKRAIGKQGKIHPATRVFQALRIAVNDEIYSLEQALPQAFSLLTHGGKLAVISFHSLEDRVVKQQFKAWEKEQKGKSLTKKPIEASEQEVRINARARSAKLRIFEKL